MPELSVLFIRTALIYFMTGFCLGALLLINKAFMIDARLWVLLPVHYHLLFLGWIIQLVFGVAFWILPKFGSSYGNIRLAWLSYIFLNSGLIILTVLHTIQIFSDSFRGLFFLAALLIISGIFCFVRHGWSRVKPGMVVKGEG